MSEDRQPRVREAAPDSELLVERLVARYREPLLSYFVRRVRNAAEAEDLTQEVFLRIVRHLDGSDIDNAEAFLFRTAANLLRDRARRESTRAKLLTETGAHEPHTEELTPERVLQGREALRVLSAALEELGEKTRTIFLLYHMENLKYAE